jgi:uncharacterized protein with von Willebrand factor type A (vWA) domain
MPESNAQELISTDAIKDGTQALHHDAWDVQEFDRATATWERLAGTMTAASESLNTAPALIRDLFWSFHKRAPRINDEARLKAAYEINRQIVEEVMQTSEWRQLRESGSVSDSMLSAIATIGASEQALKSLDPKECKQINQLAATTEAAEKFFKQAEALNELSGQANPEQAKELRAQAEKARASAKRKERIAARLTQQLAAGSEERLSTIRQAARRGMSEALAEAEATQNALAAFGGGYSRNGGEGDGQREMNAQEKFALAERVLHSPKLSSIAEMSGRFKRIALSVQKSKVDYPPSQITSITIGADLAHILPGELALLADSATEDLFYLKFAERRLLQYELIGCEPEGRGPIILAVDESGSMKDSCGPMTKEVWSKAVMLALQFIARKHQRDFAVIHFSGTGNLRVDLFQKGNSTPEEVIACAEHFFNRGTVFEEWMEEALELVDESAFEKADVICVSDGLTEIASAVQEEWKKRRAVRGMRAYSVLVGTTQGEELLYSISDAVFVLDDLADDLPALKTIFSV